MKSITPIITTLRASNSRCIVSLSCRATALLASRTPHRQQRSSFFGGSFTPNQTLTTTKTLSYPSSAIYDVISDVGAYSQFVPYCIGSIVTKKSQPAAADGKQYPEEAKLLIGFNNDISEEFTSRVYCVPGRIVEAVSGRTDSTLSGEDIAHHSARAPADQDPSRRTNTMTHLLTRWTLRPDKSSEAPDQQKTEVSLAIEFSFANPLYAALSATAAPKIADKMIDAFEKRVKAVAEEQRAGKPQGKRMQGVIGSK